MITKEFRRMVRDGLKRQELSLSQAAKNAELSPGYLSRVLRGERDFPSTDAILRLALVLGIHPPDLLLAQAGRVRHRAGAELTKKELDQVMKIIHDVVQQDRRSTRKDAP